MTNPTSEVLERLRSLGKQAVQAMIDMPVGDRAPTFRINRKEALSLLESYRHDVERETAATIERLSAELERKDTEREEAISHAASLLEADGWIAAANRLRSLSNTAENGQ